MKFRVGGNDYKVETSSQLSPIYNQWGHCRFGDNTIQIAEGLCESRRKDTLIHELTHAILFEAGYEAHEEELVNRVGKVLYQVLRDNDFDFIRNGGEADE
jgi:hypothetical protein